MKQCTKCKEIKPLIEFYARAKSKDGYNSACKNCHGTITHDWYIDNKELRLKQIQRRDRMLRQRNSDLKASRGCMICREEDPACLEWHHVDPATKEYVPSDLVTNVAWAVFEREIEKCVVLCSNCHKKYHAGRFSLIFRV